MDRKLSWPEVFEFIGDYCTKYCEDSDVEEWWSNNRVIAKFRIDDLDHAINARASKSDNGEYEIVFCAGLLDAFVKYAHEVTYHSSIIFEPAKKPEKNSVALERAHIWLVMIWVDYVFQHEFAHIFCGHLELLNDSASAWNELGAPNSMTNLSTHEVHCLEVQADRFASANILSQYLRYHENISADLYGETDSERFLVDYIYAILYLYKLFESLQTKKPSLSHPEPFFRGFIFSIFFRDTYGRVPEVPKIDKKHLENIFRGSYIEFYRLEGGMSLERFKEKLTEAQEFFNNISPTLKTLKLSTL